RRLSMIHIFYSFLLTSMQYAIFINATGHSAVINKLANIWSTTVWQWTRPAINKNSQNRKPNNK
ncbi:TPA: hypothetical protein ACYX8Z_004247, partial [Klebsiella pneumoniae]